MVKEFTGRTCFSMQGWGHNTMAFLEVRAGGNGAIAEPPTFEVFADGKFLGVRNIVSPKLTPGFDLSDDSLFQDYTFSVDGPVESVEIVFLNDIIFDGVDVNLMVDFISVNGQVFEAEVDGFFTRENGDPPSGPREELFWAGTLRFDNLPPVPGRTITGTAQDDTLNGTAGRDTLLARAGDDVLFGRAGEDALIGLDGDDILLGGLGGDRLVGGNGSDRAQYSQAASGLRADLQAAGTNTGEAAGDSYESIENLHGSAHDDVLLGNGGRNLIFGSDGNDFLVGRGGKDTLLRGDGNDQLLGGLGGDILNGGDGMDRAQYSGAAGGLRADLGASGTNTGEAAGDVYISVENLLGSAFDDTLLGNASDNVILGGDGDDLITGRSGGDALHGGDGSDWAIYLHGTSRVRVDLEASEAFDGEAEGDTFFSIENLFGSNFNDVLQGDVGDNIVRGANGNDLLNGRGGDDLLIGGLGADRHIGGAGDDRAQYSQAAEKVRADLQFSHTNTGEATGDTFVSIENLFGSAHNDVLLGDSRQNIIFGAAGNDMINGRAGDDTLFGMAGADRFIFASGRRRGHHRRL